MWTTTVRNVLQGVWDEADESCLYVIREEEVIFYIGKSNDTQRRLLEHFDASWRSSGAGIGSFYKMFQNEAVRWSIDLYSLEDCEPFVQAYCAAMNFPYHQRRSEKSAVSQAERALIWWFHPCLNDTYNDDPTELPERYWPKVSDEKSSAEYEDW